MSQEFEPVLQIWNRCATGGSANSIAKSCSFILALSYKDCALKYFFQKKLQWEPSEWNINILASLIHIKLVTTIPVECIWFMAQGVEKLQKSLKWLLEEKPYANLW